MKLALPALAALSLLAAAPIVRAQQGPGGARPASGPMDTAAYKATYIRLGGNDSEGLLYEPREASAKSRIAMVFAHPQGNNFNEPLGREMSRRGYRVLMVNYRGGSEGAEAQLPSISRGIAYLRTLPGVQKVILVGHSGGGATVPLYVNVAQHGPTACSDAAKIYPCRTEGLTGLQVPDGMVLLDPVLGGFHQMSSVDPAESPRGRIAALDMFSPANGFDPATKRATYKPDFAARFYKAQSARNMQIIDAAVARLKVIEAGKGEFRDDEPLTLKGVGVLANGARLYQPDPTFAGHTKAPHTVIKADGTEVQAIVQSVRPPSGQSAAALGTLGGMTRNTTVREFLAGSAVRTTIDYAITPDDITGVDWHSSYTLPVGNAEGITVPTLVMANGCHYLMVPAELIFNHLASKDKSYAAVEGATHLFTPCKPEYGDTVKRVFDYVDGWASKDGRF